MIKSDFSLCSALASNDDDDLHIIVVRQTVELKIKFKLTPSYHLFWHENGKHSPRELGSASRGKIFSIFHLFFFLIIPISQERTVPFQFPRVRFWRISAGEIDSYEEEKTHSEKKNSIISFCAYFAVFRWQPSGDDVDVVRGKAKRPWIENCGRFSCDFHMRKKSTERDDVWKLLELRNSLLNAFGTRERPIVG